LQNFFIPPVFETDADIGYTRVNKFSQKSSPRVKISRRQTSDVKQVPCWRPKGIRRHLTRFCRPGDLAIWICALLGPIQWIFV